MLEGYGMVNHLRTNDIILKTATTVIVFVILAFAIFLFIAGHNAPGGGFVGGLVTSGALILLYIAYGFETMERVIKINYRILLAIGLATAVLTGLGSFLFGVPFLSETFGHFHLPIFGDVELATAMIFDLGVYLTVVGVTMTIMLSIAEDV
jgi:multicomponent Na+:H+ antiporter subunit B